MAKEKKNKKQKEKITKRAGKKVGGFFGEFKTFALKGNVMSMAIGVIIGGAFSGLVTSLTANIITPILNCFGKLDGQAAKLAWKIRGQSIEFGAFLADVLNFIIMAFIVFLLVKFMNSLAELGKKEKEAAPPTTKKCPYCKSDIALDATRCPHCTSELDPV